MHIRKATTEDVDALGALLARSRQVSGSGNINEGHDGQRAYSEDQIRRIIADENGAVYVAVEDDTIVAFTVVEPGETDEVFVDESRDGDAAGAQSLGSTILEATRRSFARDEDSDTQGATFEQAEPGTYSFDHNPYDVADTDNEPTGNAYARAAHRVRDAGGQATSVADGDGTLPHPDDSDEYDDAVPYGYDNGEDDAVPYSYDSDDYAMPYADGTSGANAEDDAVPYVYGVDEDDAVPYTYDDADDGVPYPLDEPDMEPAARPAYAEVPKTAYSDAAAAARNASGRSNPYASSFSPDSPSYYRRGRPPIPERPHKKKRVWNVTFIVMFVALVVALGVLGGIMLRQFVFVSGKAADQVEKTPVAPVVADEAADGRSNAAGTRTPDAVTPGDAAAVVGSDYVCEPAQVDLMMIGDVLMHDEVVNAGYQPDGTFNYDFLYAEIVPWIQEADLRILNQETVMGNPALGHRLYMGAAGPIMNTPTALADTEVRYGFNCILKATNHSLDLGYDGLRHELDYWYDNYPNTPVVGVNNPAKAFTDDQSQNWVDNVYVVDIDGLKVGILNYTWATNESFDWTTDHAVISYMSEDKIAADVEKARLNGAEFIVACPHWGIEYSTEPSYEEYYYSKIFCDLGVDVIFGCHPHVLQPVEVLTNAEGHQTVCFYSMSNFVCASIMVDNSFIGGIARATLTRDEHGGYAVTAASLIPTVIHYAYDETMRPYPLAAYTNEMAMHSMRPAVTPGYAYDFCAAVFGDGFDRDLGFYILNLPQEGRRV